MQGIRIFEFSNCCVYNNNIYGYRFNGSEMIQNSTNNKIKYIA